jgi:hypothetical protein
VDYPAGIRRSDACWRRLHRHRRLLVDAHAMDISIHQMPRNPAAEEKFARRLHNSGTTSIQGHEPDPDFTRDAETIKAMWRSEKQPPNEIDLSGNNLIRHHWKNARR